MNHSLSDSLRGCGQYLAIVFFAVLLSGCATTGSVDHSVEIKKVGAAKITDVTLVYGAIRPIHAASLGIGGGGWTRTMEIPELATVTWTTEDRQKHEEKVPVRAKAPRFMDGKIVSFEIHGSQLKVFIDKRLPDFKRDRTQIYGL
jgi:hypothetical protein